MHPALQDCRSVACLARRTDLASVLELNGRRAEAVEILRELATEARDPDIYARLGQLSIRAGDLDGAEAAQRRAIELDPASVDCHRALADVLDAKGRPDQASEILKHLVQSCSDDAQLHARLGQVLIRNGDLAGAEAALRSALAIDPALPEARRNLDSVLAQRQRC